MSSVFACDVAVATRETVAEVPEKLEPSETKLRRTPNSG